MTRLWNEQLSDDERVVMRALEQFDWRDPAYRLRVARVVIAALQGMR